MGTVTQEEVREVIGDDHHVLRECVYNAFADLKEFQAEKHPNMRVRARRTMLQDLVVRGVHDTYSETPGFRVVDPKTGRYLLCVRDRFILQMKHLTHEFQTVNTPTETAKLFNAQADVEGMPPLPRITLGYRLDQLESAVEGVYLLFSINNVPVWWYRIEDADETGMTGAETLPLFPPKVDPAADTPARRVTPKVAAEGEGTRVIPLFGKSG